MPLPAGAFIRHSIGGACGSDRWSINVWAQLTGLTGNPTSAEMDSWASSILTAFNTDVWSAASNPWKGQNPSGVTLDSCHAALYQSGALTQNGNAVITAVPGTNAIPHPFYVAAVATLLTASAGRSARGRIYLPAAAMTVAAGTGLFSTLVQGHVDNLATFLQAIGPDISSFPGDPACHAVVVSRTAALSGNITAVRVDNKPDTQRGRQGKISASSTFSHSVT